jgi:hypothetical protein
MKTLWAAMLIGLLGQVLYAQPMDTVWTHRYGGFGSEWAYAAVRTADSGFVLAGSTTSSTHFSTYSDFWLLKINSQGDSLWSRNYGGRFRDAAYSIIQTPDSGFLVSGYSSTDSYDWVRAAVVFKVNASGDSLWSIRFNPIYYGVCASLSPSADGHYYVAGNWGREGNGVCLAKITDNGSTLWSLSNYRNLGNQTFSAIGTPDSGALVTGWVHGTCYTALVRYNSDGDTLWTRRFDQYIDNHPYCIRSTDDGEFVLSGSIATGSQINRNGWIVKLNRAGSIEWQNEIGQTNRDEFFAVQALETGGYVLAGFTHPADRSDPDFWVVRTDEQGDSVWSASFGDTSPDTARAIVPTADGDFLVIGTTTFADSGGADFFAVKLHPAIPNATPREPVLASGYALSAYPNPFNPSTQIEFKLPGAGLATVAVFDILGQQVATLQSGPLAAGTHRVTFDGQRLPSGIYFVRLESASHHETMKLVLMK